MMRNFHILINDRGSIETRRVDFFAEGPDHAFQIARNECQGVDLTLWEGEAVLARMTNEGAGLWKIHPSF